MPGVSTISTTGNAYIDGVLSGTKWAVSSFTYSFPTDPSLYTSVFGPYGSGEPSNGFKAFTATQQAAVSSILTMYAAVANVTFSLITETTGQSATLRYAESNSPSTAWTYFPSSLPEGGDAWFNNSSHLYDNPVIGNYAWLTLIHETGHALGLKHPHETSGSFGIMPVDHDSLEYSVMSYRSYIGASTSAGLGNGTFSFPTTLMMYDIAALQVMYGANYTTNATNTVYKWDPTTGQESINGVAQTAPGGNKIFMTLWDGGGHDTYDFSNYTTNLTVSLQPGAWTTLSAAQVADLGSGHSAAGNIANALLFQGNTASLIDDAIGGTGNDIITGNAADNKLTGGAGNDTLDGDAGSDTAAYSGTSANYQFVHNANGSWTVTDLRAGSPDGVDTLTNIEFIQFSNQTVAIDTLAPGGLQIPTFTSFSANSGSAGDAITNDNTLTLSGAGTAGSTISIYDLGTLLGVATVADTGLWSFDTAVLTDGNHSFTATASDGVVVTSTSLAFAVTIDTAAPAAPLISSTISTDSGASNSDHITNDNTVTLTGTAEAGSTVAILDGATQLGTVTATGGNWSFTTLALADGAHSFTATATDIAGNIGSASSALSVTIDTAAPAAPLISSTISTDSGASNSDHITNDNTVTLTGTAEAGSTVAILDGATQLGTVTATGGNWSFTTLALADGAHSFTATATDIAGNIGSASSALSVTIDTAAPAAPLISSTISTDSGASNSDHITNDNTVTLTGTAEAGSTVAILDGATQLGTVTATGGNWSFTTLALADGAHSFTATATDIAGNIGSASSALSVTIDTAAPAAPLISSTISTDSGASNSDHITNDNTVTLTGTAEANSTVSIFDGATLLGTVAANGAGAWTYTTAALIDGIHGLTAKATDTAGNVSVASTALSVTIDTAAPAAPLISSTISTDSGASNSDHITNDNTVTLTGTAEAGSTVAILDGATQLGTVTATGGNWSFTTLALIDGIHGLTAKATDTAGNVSVASTALSVTIDTAAPAAPLISSFSPDTNIIGDGSTSVDILTLTGTAEAGSTVAILDGATQLGTVTATGGNWSFTTLALADGAHSFTATATDTAGNTGTVSSALGVVVDTAGPPAPTITSFSPDSNIIGDRITNANSLILTGIAVLNSTVSIYDGAGLLGTVPTAGDGTWIFNTGVLNDGTYSILATSTVLGVTGPSSDLLSVTIDTAAPAAPLISSTISTDSGASNSDHITNDNTVTLTGTAEANSTVSIFDGATLLGTVAANGAGAWTYTTAALIDGIHGLTAKATDTAGNVSVASTALSVTIDTAAPAAPLISSTISTDSGASNSDHITNDNTVTLTGTAEAGSTVAILDGATQLGTVTATGGNWSFTTLALADGAHSFTATATDIAGNIGSASSALSVTIDTAAPAAPLISSTISTDSGASNSDHITNDNTVTLTGTAEAGSTVAILDGATQLGTVTATGGNWSFTTLALADGAHSFTATATDIAGNIGSASSALSVTIDTAAPAAPLISSTISTDSGASNSDHITNDNTVTLTGTAEANSTVSIFDGATLLGTVAANGAGAWTYTTAALIDGIHGLTAKATDTAGNVSVASTALSVTIDTAAPAAPLISSTISTDSGASNSDHITNDNTVTLTGTAEAGSTVAILDGATQLGTVTATGGNWSFTTLALIDGIHGLTAKATDTAGNVSVASTALSVTIDTAAPAAPSISSFSPDTGTVGDHLTGVNTLTLTGTAEANSALNVFDGATLLGTATVNGSGAWSYATAALPNGLHSFSSKAIDTAGNTSAASASLAVTVAVIHPPVVNVTGSVTLKSNIWLAGNLLPFTTSDQDGHAIQTYRFTDTDSGSSTARMWTSSGLYVAQGGSVDVAASNLANFWIQGGTAGDTIQVQAYDGVSWSAAQNITIAAPVNHAPTVNVTGTGSVSLKSAAWVEGTALPFTATDSDGDAIQTYRFTDTDSGSSTARMWTSSGLYVAQGGSVDVAASNLANFWIQGGGLSDTIQVQAFDGTVWSAAQNITIAAPVNHAPTVNVTGTGSVSLKSAAWVEGTALPFTATDSDGDAIQTYRFTDTDSGSSTARMWTSSGLYVAQGGSVDVAASNLANFWIQGGGLSDTIQVQAFDGTVWSAAQNITIAAPVNHAPTVNVTGTGSVSLKSAAWVEGTALPFTATDSDGDAIQTYRFTDTDSGSSTARMWTSSGLYVAQGGSVDVAASNLANFWIQGGTAGDTIQVQAYDGVSWSAAQNITIAAPVNHAPTVNVTGTGSVSLKSAAWVEGTALPFTATDSDGDAIQTYRFTDTDSGSSTARMWTSSGLYVAQGGSVDVAASNLANFWIQGGGLSDTIQVQAFDGTVWSAAQNITIAAPVNHAPTVNVTGTGSVSLKSAAWVEGTALPFTATDSDGDAIQTYRFTDTDSGSSTARMWTSSGLYVAQGGSVDVAASNLANFWIQGGGLSDTIQVQAFDGTVWSAAQNITIAAPVNHAPLVTASGSLSLLADAWVQGTALPFHVSDSDGDAVQAYRFTDVGSDSTTAHMWYLGQNYLAQGATFDVSAANLGNFWIQGGSVSDTLQVQFFDGTVWSGPENITISPTSARAPSLAGSAIINENEMLDVSSSYSGLITFAGTNGVLKLHDSSSFSGIINGLTGHDTINFADVDFAQIRPPIFSGDSNGGTLTVTDSIHTANIALSGDFLNSEWTASNDGHGGTNVVASPPLVNATDGTTIFLTPTANDTFVFLPNLGNETIAHFQPENEVIQFSHVLFADAAAVVAHAADDGRGNVVITHDMNNSVTLQHITLASLHASDFIVV